MYPKPSRIVDKELLDRVRSKNYCELSGLGACSGGLDVHHIVSRGAGGDDVMENLVLLCRGHHQQVHSGIISKDMLRHKARWNEYLRKDIR